MTHFTYTCDRCKRVCEQRPASLGCAWYQPQEPPDPNAPRTAKFDVCPLCVLDFGAWQRQGDRRTVAEDAALRAQQA